MSVFLLPLSDTLVCMVAGAASGVMSVEKDISIFSPLLLESNGALLLLAGSSYDVEDIFA